MWTGAFLLAMAGFLFSSNPLLWAISSICLPLAFEFSSAGMDKPIVIAHLTLFWAAIFNSLLITELRPIKILMSPDEVVAAYLSLLALLAISIGYRIGFSFWARRSRQPPNIELNRGKLVAAYFTVFFSTSVLTFLAAVFPLLTQPILAFMGVKLLLLYLLCSQVLADRKGYAWMLAAVLAELVQGATGYIASYQLALLVVIAAAIRSRGVSIRGSQLAVAVCMGALLVWASLVWTAVKPEFRAWLATENAAITGSASEKAAWMTNYLSSGRLDYADAFMRLSDRIGYVRFYALALPKLESAYHTPTDFWPDALINTFMPRFLFPDKPILNDTKITSELTGVQFGANTSVSIGFVAQTHADFGFPIMLFPIMLIGVMLGGVGGYFQSKPISQSARDAFMSAALVYKFGYEANIDKALGAFVLSAIALVIVFKFVYPIFERWAAEKDSSRSSLLFRRTPPRNATYRRVR